MTGKSVDNFLKGFHSDSTKESYCKKLAQFLEFCDTDPDSLLKKTQSDPKFFQNLIIDYV
ncbi:MAG: hypothetical protein ACREBA_02835 [Nitrosotalea sp.]